MTKNYVKRKEKIIISAIDILDEGGIQGLTTKELSKRENITEPALYRQFKSKQEILYAILDRFSIYDEGIVNTIIEQKMKSKQGILYFVESYISYYQSYPQITTILFSFDVFKYEKTSNLKITEILEKRADFIKSLVIKGQSEGEFNDEITPDELSDIIFGIMWSAAFQWKMKDCKTDLKSIVMKRIEWILKRITVL